MFKKSDYLTLCDEIWEHNRRYFVENNPTITDYDFDQLVKQLEEIEKTHPDWVFSGSPTQRIGECATSAFPTAAHKVPMLSLANGYNAEEIQEFIARIERGLNKRDLLFEVEPKFDGTAVSLRYEEGIFTRAITRGNGVEGEVITANVKTISSLPLKLKGHVPSILEVRGEIFMPKEIFKHLNISYQEAGKEPFANPRNAAAGSLKLLDPKEVAKRKLAITCYHVVEGLQSNSQHTTLKQIESFGLPVTNLARVCKNFDEIWQAACELEKQRPHLPFEIDGLVIKVDDLKLHDRLGATSKHVRWALAYKFAPEQAQTYIEKITVQVGRTGVLTPVAELTPVFLAGSTISRATLHNEEELKRKDIREKDHVFIEKGGDVIPKVVSVILEKRPKDTQAWTMPSHCPVCGTTVVQIKGEVATRCPNKKDCPAQALRRLIHFASKQGMDIEHLGEKIVTLLHELGFVKTFSDFFRLQDKQLCQLPHFKDKATHNALQALEKAKSVPLERFIMALGVAHVGAETAYLLAEDAQSIEQLMCCTEEQLLKIDGVGPKIARSIIDFFADPAHEEEIAQLLALGVQPTFKKTKIDKAHPFFGKTFVLTGALADYSREQATLLIKERGGRVSSSVSKETSYLLLGEDPGSKYEKAKKLGVAILTEEDFGKQL